MTNKRIKIKQKYILRNLKVLDKRLRMQLLQAWWKENVRKVRTLEDIKQIKIPMKKKLRKQQEDLQTIIDSFLQNIATKDGKQHIC